MLFNWEWQILIIQRLSVEGLATHYLRIPGHVWPVVGPTATALQALFLRCARIAVCFAVAVVSRKYIWIIRLCCCHQL